MANKKVRELVIHVPNHTKNRSTDRFLQTLVEIPQGHSAYCHRDQHRSDTNFLCRNNNIHIKGIIVKYISQ